MVRQRQTSTKGRATAAVLASAVLGGVVAAAGQAPLALAGTGLLVGGLAVIGERHRMVQLLWGAVALTAPLNGLRVSVLLAVSDVFLIAALTASVPDLLHRARRRVVPPSLVIAFGVIVVAGLVGTFFAPDAGASLINMGKVVLAAAGSVMALALWDPGVRRLRQFAWLWFTGATISAVIGIADRPVVGRALGLTTHPNHFGLVCVLAVGLGVGLTVSSSGRARAAAGGATGLLILGVGVSGSRSAALGLVVTIAAAALLTRRARLLIVTAVVALLFGMAVVAGVVHLPESHALSRLGGQGGAAASDAQRRETLDIAFDSISRHPFTGEGFEFAQAAHSIYVQVLVVGGPLALVGFLWACWTIGQVGVRAARSSGLRGGGDAGAARRHGDNQVVAGLTAGFAGYLASGTFDNILWDRYLWTYLGLLIVLGGSLRLAPALDPEPAALPTSRSAVPAVG